MKTKGIIIALIFVLYLLTSISFAGTVYYADSDRPDDSGDGLSWATAKKTLDAFDAILARGDTVVCRGTFGVWTPQSSYAGGSGTYTIFIDEYRYNSGVHLANPDTVWSATITGTVTYGSSDRGMKLIGFVWNAASRLIIGTGCGDNWFLQCKFLIGQEYAVYLSDSADSLYFVSCLFIHNSSKYPTVLAQYNKFLNIWNCTFYGNPVTTNEVWFLDFHFENSVNYKNNVINTMFINTDASAGTDERFVWGQSGISDWDNNIYYIPKLGGTPNGCWKLINTLYNTLAAWRTALQVYDPDGETNSLYVDPEIQSASTSCYILNDSPAFGTGRDLGYGTNIGYYQGQFLPILPLIQSNRKPLIMIW